MESMQLGLAVFWLIAGGVSFYFSIGNARVWTSIAVGFFLILVGEIIPTALPFLPGMNDSYVLAMGHIIGTISILVMSHGFQEYYVIRIVENTNWVFLSLINIDLIRKICINIKDTPISKGFVAFMVVFACIFLWKGSELYLDVYNLEAVKGAFPVRYQISTVCSLAGNFLASISVGATFLYLAKLLR